MKKSIVAIIMVVLAGIAIFSGCNPAPKKDATKPNGSGLKTTGPMTFVTKGQTPEQYVKSYYKTLIAGNLDKAYKMQPGENQKKRTLKDYKSMHSGLKIKGYKITKVEKKKTTQVITVTLTLEQFSGWKVLWTFVSHKKGWIAASSASAQMGGSSSSGSSSGTSTTPPPGMGSGSSGSTTQ